MMTNMDEVKYYTAPRDIKKELNNLRGKYIKRLLGQLEPLDIVDIVVRKIILDALNDYARDVNKELGYE